MCSDSTRCSARSKRASCQRRTLPAPADRLRVAWLVHAYTATGAVLAFVGAWAVVHGDDRRALAAMFAATIVDATDGALARRARVKDVLPDVDGARDRRHRRLPHVRVPADAAARGVGGLSARWRCRWSRVVLLSSMYGFVAPDAKTADHFFTGFPSYWNIVVLYLHAVSRAAGRTTRSSCWR